MARKCSICEHSELEQIDELLVSGHVFEKNSGTFFVEYHLTTPT